MSRSFLLDARYQHFLTEQYEKETKSRMKFFEDTKAGREYAPKSYLIGLPNIDPMQFALQKKREEDALIQKIREEARAKQVTDVMWPVDPEMRRQIYHGLSHDGEGRHRYLTRRVRCGRPEDRFTFPMLSSWQYGWKVLEDPDTLTKSKYARTSKIEESFYTRNGVPQLRDPVSGGGACQS